MSETLQRRLFPVLRYPGGKQRRLRFLDEFLPSPDDIIGRYVEPFLGGAAVFLHVGPKTAILSDLNEELVDLYTGVQADPSGVWAEYEAFGSTKDDYLNVRAWQPHSLTVTTRAARTLFLNRTCFKGNWRHNAAGQFNVGYGGQSRRWVITQDLLADIALALASAELRCSDFEQTIRAASPGDFLFLDPPYRAGHRDLLNSHYGFNQFSFKDHCRLAVLLHDAANRGVSWCMTTSSHPDITALYPNLRIVPLPKNKTGEPSGEVLILSGDPGHE